MARRAADLGMDVVATPPRTPLTGEEHGTEFAALPELLERSDVVSLHCPLTQDTRHLLDAAALRRMKRSAILVNTARAGIADRWALAAALRAGGIAGAGLDDFEDGPQASPALADLANTVLASHLGGVGTAVRDRRCALAVAGAAEALAGREPGLRTRASSPQA
ncbi:NAD(P)-dependent oxidoreductase [Marinitenerispora sediminis]|uniref:NAD(P)-dependent oxidoreductase n=1 Tax=Marinitenerispora sediminis TaxID=1931232 RepID=UPI0035A91C48